MNALGLAIAALLVIALVPFAVAETDGLCPPVGEILNYGPFDYLYECLHDGAPSQPDGSCSTSLNDIKDAPFVWLANCLP